VEHGANPTHALAREPHVDAGRGRAAVYGRGLALIVLASLVAGCGASRLPNVWVGSQSRAVWVVRWSQRGTAIRGTVKIVAGGPHVNLGVVDGPFTGRIDGSRFHGIGSGTFGARISVRATVGQRDITASALLSDGRAYLDGSLRPGTLRGFRRAVEALAGRFGYQQVGL